MKQREERSGLVSCDDRLASVNVSKPTIRGGSRRTCGVATVWREQTTCPPVPQDSDGLKPVVDRLLELPSLHHDKVIDAQL